MDNRDIVVSFSGGRSSAMMCYILEQDPEYRHRKKHYVFANTGRELTETLQFVLTVEWLLDIQVNLIEANVFEERKSTGYKLVKRGDLSTEGEPFEAVIKKYGLPNVSFPHCTRELKINPIQSFIKNHLGLKKGEYVEAIGMRYDEPRRVKHNPNVIYPLFSKKITKQDVIEFWQDPERSRYDLTIEEFEGNCDFCFKKSWAKLKKMGHKHRTRMLWWHDMERKYGSPESNLYRGHQLAVGIIREVLAEEDEKDLNCSCSFE